MNPQLQFFLSPGVVFSKPCHRSVSHRYHRVGCVFWTRWTHLDSHLEMEGDQEEDQEEDGYVGWLFYCPILAGIKAFAKQQDTWMVSSSPPDKSSLNQQPKYRVKCLMVVCPPDERISPRTSTWLDSGFAIWKIQSVSWRWSSILYSVLVCWTI